MHFIQTNIMNSRKNVEKCFWILKWLLRIFFKLCIILKVMETIYYNAIFNSVRFFNNHGNGNFIRACDKRSSVNTQIFLSIKQPVIIFIGSRSEMVVRYLNFYFTSSQKIRAYGNKWYFMRNDRLHTNANIYN